MFEILERDYKQNIVDIDKEFPNSRYIVRVDELLDESGYLLAVSTSRDSEKEFGEYLGSRRGTKYLHIGGFYERSVGFGLYELAD